MKLYYLPEGDPNDHQQWIGGWPASDHEEDDLDVARQKIASGLYEDSDAGAPRAKVSRIAKNVPRASGDATEATAEQPPTTEVNADA